MIDRIQYTGSNDRDVEAFVGAQPKCPVCGGTGEYEQDGPRGCQPCNSRLFIIRSQTPKLYADYGDWIVRRGDGTFEVIKSPGSEA